MLKPNMAMKTPISEFMKKLENFGLLFALDICVEKGNILSNSELDIGPFIYNDIIIWFTLDLNYSTHDMRKHVLFLCNTVIILVFWWFVIIQNLFSTHNQA